MQLDERRDDLRAARRRSRCRRVRSSLHDDERCVGPDPVVGSRRAALASMQRGCAPSCAAAPGRRARHFPHGSIVPQLPSPSRTERGYARRGEGTKRAGRGACSGRLRKYVGRPSRSIRIAMKRRPSSFIPGGRPRSPGAITGALPSGPAGSSIDRCWAPTPPQRPRSGIASAARSCQKSR